MVSELAQRRVRDFQQQCGEYGETALHLAYHAALPVVLNADLLHLLRINFFLDPPEPLPYTVEFAFLLSPLCREIDEGLYEIEPEIRDILLARLAQEYGEEHIRDVATLLWQYVDRFSPWSGQVELERAQQLTALNFLDTEKARQWLSMIETSISQDNAAYREWFVAMSQQIENRNRSRHLEILETERVEEFSETALSNSPTQPTHDITTRPFPMDDMRFAKIATIKLDPLPHPTTLIEETERHYHQRNGEYDPSPITLNSIAEYLRHRYSNYDDLCRELGSYNEKARNVLKCRVNETIWTALSSLDTQLVEEFSETASSNPPTRDITARPFNMDDMRFAKIATIKLDPLPHPKILIEETERHYHHRNGEYDPSPITLNSIAEYLRHRYSNYDDLCRELGSYNEKARNVLKCRVNATIWMALSSLDIQLDD